jgi:protein ImuB
VGRIACAFVPRFELALRARGDPTLWAEPLAVVELASGAQRVRACTPAAEARGVCPGQLVGHARGLCPELELVPPDETAAKKAERDLLAALSTLSPWLDADGRGAFFLGLEGLARLVKTERHFAQDVRKLLHKEGLTAQVAVADGPFVAWVTARRLSGVTCIPAGAEVQHLSRIPAGDLGLSDRAQELLDLLGVRTAGAMTQLPKGSLARRLGAEGARIERLCHGQVLNAWPSATKVPTPAESVSLELEVPTEALEPLLFLAKSLMDRLLGALAHSRVALVQLTIVARLDDKTELSHALTPAEPTLDARTLTDLFRLWLDAKPFRSPVAALTLVASGTGAAQARQLSLFRQREQEEYAALERAVARLASAFGTEAVVRPALADTYRPEARLRWVPFSGGAFVDAATGEAGSGPPPTVLKLKNPPEPVRWPGAWLERPGKPALQVLHAEGPHKLCGEWWEAPFDRSYYWLACAGGELYWVFRDESTGQCFLAAEGD